MASKSKRIAVQNETIKAFELGRYTTPKGNNILINKGDILNCTKNTTYHTFKEVDQELSKRKIKTDHKTKILLFNKDSLEAGVMMQHNGYNPVILNMASFKNPGGGYLNGASAQEESLFRRTCLHLCLDGENKNKLYPIAYDAAIYSKDVLAVRRSEELNYEFVEKYRKLSIISSSAYKCGVGEVYTDKIKKIMKYKLEMIFKLGILYEHDSLMLGAFGCGAYHNPANIIAEICKELIQEYDGYYRCIAFAILDDRNATINGAIHGYADGNLETFRKILGVKIIN